MGLEGWNMGEPPEQQPKNHWARDIAEFIESGQKTMWMQCESKEEARTTADRLRCAARSKALKEQLQYSPIYVGVSQDIVSIRRLDR